MNILRTICTTVIFSLFGFSTLSAQTAGEDRVNVAFSHPGSSGLLQVDLIHGSIVVEGSDGAEVIIVAKTRSDSEEDETTTELSGMRRLSTKATGLSVTEKDNVMAVEAATLTRAVDLNIQVPRKTSLQLNTVNGGHIKVENVTGEIDLHNVNGEVTAHNVSGSVLANTTNGKVVVTFEKVKGDKAMSFVSFNGDVDVTLPANTQATLRVKPENGDVYSDFDIDFSQNSSQIMQEDSRAKGGRFKLSVESTMTGNINGGGPDYHFSTWNGNIYIRKK